MARKDLIPLTERTKEEQKKIRTAGGIASGASRRRKKTMREWAEIFGALPIEVNTPGGGKKKTDLDGAVIFGQYQSAIKKQNTKAAYFLAQLKGELEEKVTVSSDQPLVIVRNQEEKDKIDKLEELGV